MKRRMLATVLSLMMLLGLMIPAASAKDGTGPSLTVTASETTVHPGDVVTYTITMGPVSELLSMQLQVDLPEGLTYVEKSGKLDAQLSDKLQFDGLPITWTEKSLVINGAGLYNNYTSDQDTVLATFQCRVDEDASGELAVGLTYLEFVCGTFVNNDYYDVTDSVQVVPAQMEVVVPVTGITLTPDTLTLEQGETETLTANVLPATASNQGVNYTTSNPDVATVDPDGTVHAVGEGQATITATTADGGFSATCVVTVPHQHSFGQDWAHDDQNHWHECVSGDGATDSVAPHTGGTATCEQQAICEVCGAPYGELADHTLNHVERVDATHFAPGHIEYWECSVCHKLFQDADGKVEISQEDTVLPQIPHDYGTDWVTDADKHWHECGCGNIIDVGQHSFTWVVDQEATEETTGLKHEECTICGYSRNEGTVIDKLDHELTFHPMVEATCVQEGNVAYYSCANCGRNFADEDATQVLTDVVIPVDPHHHTGKTLVKDAVEATCTKDGYTGDTYCADCGEKLQSGDVISATGHSLEHVARLEPTHAAPGHIEYWQCTTCQALFADEEGKEPVSAEDVVLAQIPHSFGEAWVSDGTGHWHVCACGAKSQAEAHTFGDWKTTQEATETAAGSRERACAQCGYVETQTVAPLAPSGGDSDANSGSQNTGDQTSQDSQSKGDSPKTGDESLMGVCLVAVVLAGGGLAALTLVSKKRRDNR